MSPLPSPPRRQIPSLLPSPSIGLNPAPFSIVNLATWLWIDAGIWHSFEATATAGGITATAVATPQDVVWSMGDGSTVVCRGPGIVYQASEPQTYCSHTFRVPSVGQPSSDGDPNDGAFRVVASVTWAVRWSAVGVPGGGQLPSLHTSVVEPVRVEQVESIGTAG